MRGARILDVDIVLVSPNNNDRPIEDSCPACVMRMVNDLFYWKMFVRTKFYTYLTISETTS